MAGFSWPGMSEVGKKPFRVVQEGVEAGWWEDVEAELRERIAERRSGGHDTPDELGQPPDREVLAGSNIHMTLAVVFPHQEQAGVRQVHDVQELPARVPA